MRILQITAAYKPAYIYGGPTMSVAALCEQLQAAGCRVQVFTTTANGAEELDVTAGEPVDVDGVPVIYFKRITKDHSHLSPALLKALWHDVKNYDVVHLHAWWNLVSVFSCMVALLRGVPVVLSPRGTLSYYSFQHRNSQLKKIMHTLLSRFLLRKCFLHTTSPQEEADIRQLTGFKCIFTLPNFVNLPEAASNEKQADQAPLKLLFYSRIDLKKGLEPLLQALPLLQIPYHLTIAGTGDEHYIDTLKALAKHTGIDSHVTWAGFQGKDKFTLLWAHDLLILPSYNENFGNVVIESLSMGTAVLISKYVGLADYVKEHRLGWICDLQPENIAEQIELINQQRFELARISREAPALVRESFTGGSLALQYMAQYQNILNSFNTSL